LALAVRTVKVDVERDYAIPKNVCAQALPALALAHNAQIRTLDQPQGLNRNLKQLVVD
jgi:hypothetical protein